MLSSVLALSQKVFQGAKSIIMQVFCYVNFSIGTKFWSDKVFQGKANGFRGVHHLLKKAKVCIDLNLEIQISW